MGAGGRWAKAVVVANRRAVLAAKASRQLAKKRPAERPVRRAGAVWDKGENVQQPCESLLFIVGTSSSKVDRRDVNG